MKDGGGQKLADVYYEDEPGRRSAAKLLTKDEARIAANVAVASAAAGFVLVLVSLVIASSEQILRFEQRLRKAS